MATTTQRLEALKRRREDLKAKLAAVGDMRRGSLVGRYRKCGKPNCHCAASEAAGHGPCWSLTRDVDGKTATKVIPGGPAVERTREQIAEYRRFRGLTRELVEVSELVCDAQIGSPEAASQEAAKKGASKHPSRGRSSPRSKRS